MSLFLCSHALLKQTNTLTAIQRFNLYNSGYVSFIILHTFVSVATRELKNQPIHRMSDIIILYPTMLCLKEQGLVCTTAVDTLQ